MALLVLWISHRGVIASMCVNVILKMPTRITAFFPIEKKSMGVSIHSWYFSIILLMWTNSFTRMNRPEKATWAEGVRVVWSSAKLTAVPQASCRTTINDNVGYSHTHTHRVRPSILCQFLLGDTAEMCTYQCNYDPRRPAAGM